MSLTAFKGVAVSSVACMQYIYMGLQAYLALLACCRRHRNAAELLLGRRCESQTVTLQIKRFLLCAGSTPFPPSRRRSLLSIGAFSCAADMNTVRKVGSTNCVCTHGRSVSFSSRLSAERPVLGRKPEEGPRACLLMQLSQKAREGSNAPWPSCCSQRAKGKERTPQSLSAIAEGQRAGSPQGPAAFRSEPERRDRLIAYLQSCRKPEGG